MVSDINYPLVSVIIPTYNHGRFVSAAVESALHQDYRPLEIIVIDDGSTDATRAVLAPFGDSIMYVYQNNAGLPSARNAGINIAKGDFVAFLDADDIWCSNKLSVQMEPMLSDKNVRFSKL